MRGEAGPTLREREWAVDTTSVLQTPIHVLYTTRTDLYICMCPFPPSPPPKKDLKHVSTVHVSFSKTKTVIFL